MSEHIIDLFNITKNYGDTEVLKDLSLYVRTNEFLTILGPSGCGKTTLLRIISGFEQPDSGKVMFGGVDIADVPPYKRKVNTVFQKYSLFPHMNIYENIAFGLRVKKLPETEIRAKVKWALDLVELPGFEKRMPSSLSGGQQQRIAIARALVNEPEVLLLDEPLGALDLKLRKEMQIELKKMQRKTGITFIYVTHDQEEALTMSDTIVVMNQGVIQQIGTPEMIYNEPTNAFVAQFIGESNILSGVMLKDKLCEFAGQQFECVDTGFGKDEDVDIVVRPEDVIIVPEDEGQLKGVVESVIFKGLNYEMIVKTDLFTWKCQSPRLSEVGQHVGLRIDPFNIQIMKIPYNILTGWMLPDNMVDIGQVNVQYDPANANSQDFEKEEAVNVYILPQFIEILSGEPDEDKINVISGEVISFKYKGDDFELQVKCEGDLTLLVHTYKKVKVGDKVFLEIPVDKIRIRKREEVVQINDESN